MSLYSTIPQVRRCSRTRSDAHAALHVHEPVLGPREGERVSGQRSRTCLAEIDRRRPERNAARVVAERKQAVGKWLHERATC